MDLHRFYFAHPELFIIPVEHLSDRGMSGAFAEAVRQERGLSEGAIELFDRAYATYWERATELHARAPETWFPPRRQNLAVVLRPEHTRPYYQPFHKSSWMLYASDFDPSTSNLEHATYQLLHAERLSTSRDIAMAIICGMSYWLLSSDEQIEAFGEAAAASPRPDARAFQRLADAMPWVRALVHDPLRPPASTEAGSALRPIREAQLYVTPEQASALQALVPRLRQDAAAVMERYLEATATAPATDIAIALAPSPADHVCRWLSEHRPPLLVVDERDQTLWDPKAPRDTAALRAAIAEVGGGVAQSLREDLRVVGEHSRRFLASLRHPERLPMAGDDVEVEQEGGVYVHATRPLIVYGLTQPGLDPRREPAPPYHRLLVGARTIHEWGHLAEAAGWVGLPADRQDDHARAQQAIEDAVQALLAAAPEPFTDAARADAESAGRKPGTLACDLMLARMPDYLCNLLARRYLEPEELQAYVRANVHTHFGEEDRMLRLLARHAFEAQYLALGGIDDPLDYVLHSTWLSDYIIDTGLVSREHLQALFDAAARLCECYAVDENAFVS